MNPILLVYIVLFVAVFYLLAVRPQRRQRRAHQEMVSMLKKGDEIVTIGGLFGTVRKMGPDYVELEIANRTRVKFLKRAISTIVSEEEDEDEYVDEDAEDTEATQLAAGSDEAEDTDEDADTADGDEEDEAAVDEDEAGADEESAESAAKKTKKTRKMK
jgi:preprotein translocase subunit YajC